MVIGMWGVHDIFVIYLFKKIFSRENMIVFEEICSV